MGISVELSDVVVIHTLELLKLPVSADGTQLYDWANFIAAETEEELTLISERNPVVEKAVVTLRELSADERARDRYERREKARRDIASREKWAVKEKVDGIVQNALRKQISIDDIIDITGLSREEIESIRDTN
ncbi:MAG: Rpn family recombination-promoting nuclease/putative transposase [Clostridiales bacterium]|nr:Rpn family recombination-promoting nuclease/putative transposase [Clostridiales bacterium]